MGTIRRILKGVLIWLITMLVMFLIFSSIYPDGTKMPIFFPFFILIFPVVCAVQFSKVKLRNSTPVKKSTKSKQVQKPSPIQKPEPPVLHFPEDCANAIGGGEQIEIVILRKKQIQSAAKTYQVFLDNKLVASLPNGGMARFKTCLGSHKLAFKGYLRIENFFDINIDGKNKEEKFYATISLKTGKIVIQEANGPEYDHVFSQQEPASQENPPSAIHLKKQGQKVVHRSAGLARIDKMDGHDFEHFTADLLRKLGYERVEVTRGSGDQGVDVIAVKDGKRYAIQCKRYSQKLGNKPVQEVFAGKTIYGCSVAVVLTNNYFTDGAKEAAKATGVELWDRDTLRRMIDYANYKAIV